MVSKNICHDMHFNKVTLYWILVALGHGDHDSRISYHGKFTTIMAIVALGPEKFEPDYQAC